MTFFSLSFLSFTISSNFFKFVMWDFHVLNNIHILLILQFDFFIYVDVMGPAPLYAKLNPLCSQILQMCSTRHHSKSSLCPWQLKKLRTQLKMLKSFFGWSYNFIPRFTRMDKCENACVTCVTEMRIAGAYPSKFFGPLSFHCGYK